MVLDFTDSELSELDENEKSMVRLLKLYRVFKIIACFINQRMRELCFLTRTRTALADGRRGC